MAPKKELYCGNSGTTIRLMAGLLCAQNFKSTLSGDISLSKRPMKRIIAPLSLMGARLKSNEGKAPLVIERGELNGIEYKSPIASAQVKSAILLAGLQTPNGKTTVLEPSLSRNHTERMLQFFGSDIETFTKDGLFGVTIGQSSLIPKDLNVVGDISSAAFIMVATSIVKNSDVILKNIGLNPTRTGLIDVMKRMKANINILNCDLVSNEEVGDIRIQYSPDMEGCEISGNDIPRLIDELPIIVLLATQAKGTTTIDNAAKEPHIVDVANFLNTMGADIRGAGTDMIKINGVEKLSGNATYSVVPDQIEAGTFMLAAVATRGDITLKNCITKHLESITAKIIEVGGKVEDHGDSIRVWCNQRPQKANIKTLPYPGFPTDLQPQMGVVMALAEGTSIINESIWESRFQYTDELNKMGAKITAQGKTAFFEGVRKLSGAPVYSTDLRAGAALVIAGTVANGSTEIYNLEHIDRGYENIEEKFRKLGAKIERVTE